MTESDLMEVCGRCTHTLWAHSMDAYPDRYENCHAAHCGCSGFIDKEND